jgi:hypothetical protein
MLHDGVHVGEANYPGYWMGNPSSLSRTVVGATPPPWGARARRRLVRAAR